VASMGFKHGWHEDGVPWPDGVDVLEGLVVLGDDEHLAGEAVTVDADEPVREEGEVRRRRWPPGACRP
jgi:hypothetical protein